MIGLGYAIEEGLRSLWRAGRSSAASIGTIAIAFLTLGAFLLAVANAERLADRWSASAEMSVYLDPAITDEARGAVDAWLRHQPGVLGVAFVSAEQALTRFRVDFPELTDVVTSLGTNPFPSSFEVRLATGAVGGEVAERLDSGLRGREGVSDVRYDRRWLERLRGLIAGIRRFGLAVAAILMAGAAFTVTAVVRLSLHARADEVDIMRLVGAPAIFLRGPFVVEGCILGGIGAGLALGGLWFAFMGIVSWWGPDLAGMMAPATLRFMEARDMVALVIAGLGVGSAAGLLASRAAR